MRKTVLHLEKLEDRSVPATFYWKTLANPASDLWSDPANWTVTNPLPGETHQVPQLATDIVKLVGTSHNSRNDSVSKVKELWIQSSFTDRFELAVPQPEITDYFEHSAKAVDGIGPNAMIKLTGTCAFLWRNGLFNAVNVQLDGTGTSGTISAPVGGAIDHKTLINSDFTNFGTITSTGYIILENGQLTNLGTLKLESGWRIDGADSASVIPNTNYVGAIVNNGLIEVRAQGSFRYENDVTTRVASLDNSFGGVFRVSVGNGADVLWDVDTIGIIELLSGNTQFGRGVNSNLGARTTVNGGTFSVPYGQGRVFLLQGGSLLEGVGTNSADVFNGVTPGGQAVPGGTLHPGVGTQRGVLTINGYYKQGSTGTLAIEVDSVAQDCSKLNIGEIANISGTVYVHNPNCTLTSGSLDFLNAGFNIFGVFSTFTYAEPGWMVGGVGYMFVPRVTTRTYYLDVLDY